MLCRGTFAVQDIELNSFCSYQFKYAIKLIHSLRAKEKFTMKKKSKKEKKIPNYMAEQEIKKVSDVGIRNQYAQMGVNSYYSRYGTDYINPHEERVKEITRLALQEWKPSTERVLDLACGSGEITLALKALGVKNVEGADPYTQIAFEKRTGLKCKSISFEAIVQGCLSDESYSLVICSYALHLSSDEILPILCMQLAMIAKNLLIVTPHKRPEINPDWGWNFEGKIKYGKTKAKYYVSQY